MAVAGGGTNQHNASRPATAGRQHSATCIAPPPRSLCRQEPSGNHRATAVQGRRARAHQPNGFHWRQPGGGGWVGIERLTRAGAGSHGPGLGALISAAHSSSRRPPQHHHHARDPLHLDLHARRQPPAAPTHQKAAREHTNEGPAAAVHQQGHCPPASSRDDQGRKGPGRGALVAATISPPESPMGATRGLGGLFLCSKIRTLSFGDTNCTMTI